MNNNRLTVTLCHPKGDRASNRGFTIVEVLVVLLIVSLTAAMMSSGLSIAMTSLDRLSNQNDKLHSQLGISSFRESIEQATLYHPEQVVFVGEARQLSFISARPLDVFPSRPRQITWLIESNAQGDDVLVYQNARSKMRYVVAALGRNTMFTYQYDNETHNEFKPTSGMLPNSVTIQNAIVDLVFARPKGPNKAIQPPEYVLFGEYEF